MSKTSIYAEVRQIIADKIENGDSVIVEWLTREIITSRSRIKGGDCVFYRLCAYAHVKNIVKRCIGKYDARPTTDAQLTLEGFEHLQVAYTVTRASQVVLVPVDKLTDQELEARSREYEQMAKGCQAHARELRSYLRARNTAYAA